MSADPEPTPPPHRSRPWVVRSVILLAMLITVVGVGMIGWRWMHVRFPNAALFIRGDASADGTEVTVANDRGIQIFSDRMKEANQYQLVVLVEQGIYNIIARKDGKILIRDRLYVPNGGGVLVQVKPPATAPATMPQTPAREVSPPPDIGPAEDASPPE